MEEMLIHECGIALVRLKKKPLNYYQEKYRTWRYGLNKMYLLMGESDIIGGKDGAGIVCTKLTAPPGGGICIGSGLWIIVLFLIFSLKQREDSVVLSMSKSLMLQFAQAHIPFMTECYMGHVRYSTQGKSGIEFIHPMLRKSNWRAKSLALCGNFNLTSVDAIFESISSVGQHPRNTSDTHHTGATRTSA